MIFSKPQWNIKDVCLFSSCSRTIWIWKYWCIVLDMARYKWVIFVIRLSLWFGDIATLSCASRTCKHVTGPIKPVDLRICKHSRKLVPLSLTSRRYLLSDLPVWTHTVHPSLRFQQQLFTTFRGACLRLATDSPALQSCRACDRPKFQAAPASGDFVEGWIPTHACPRHTYCQVPT